MERYAYFWKRAVSSYIYDIAGIEIDLIRRNKYVV